MAFNNAETDRAAGYDADHSRAETDHTGATTDCANAATDRTNAATDRTNAAADRTLAGTDHTRAESDHIRADADSSTVAGFNTRLMALDARTEFEMGNAVVNGDFSNGTTGWANGGDSVNTTANNILSNTVTTNQYDNAFVVQSLNLKKNNKYYILGSFRVRDSGAVSALVLLYNGSQLEVPAAINLPVKDVWYTSSNLFTPTTDDAKTTQMRFRHEYPSGDLANGKVLEVKYVSVIDLTTAFGAGKEPTLAEFERILARFPNSWFDGVKPIQTIETLYQEKANKAQEAWITPTLLNGWVEADASKAPRYMKDTLGFVHLKGMVKSGSNSSTIFTLPSGYRLDRYGAFPVDADGTFGKINISPTGDITYLSGSNAGVSLENITFKVD